MRTTKFLLTLLLLTGCAHEGPAPGRKPTEYEAPMDSVAILDKDLAEWNGIEWLSHSKIAVEQHRSRRLATGSVETEVVLRNRTDSPLAVELRTLYFDDTRFALDKPSEWQPMNLPPQGTDRYREVSLSPAASHYIVEVRRAHRR